MRLIDADELSKVKFHPLPYAHIVPADLLKAQTEAEAYERGWNDAIDAIIENAETIEPQQWIPVTERLPEPYSGEYFVTINDGSVYTDVLWFDSPGDGRHESCFYKTDDDGYGVVCDDVVAWMPLPESYRGR